VFHCIIVDFPSTWVSKQQQLDSCWLTVLWASWRSAGCANKTAVEVLFHPSEANVV
jgi:hypothetical protein